MHDLSEKQIESMILNWLSWKRVFAWKCKTTGTYDEKLKRFRGGSRLYKRGVSDILGILDDGRFLALEVKTRKGRIAPHQQEFLDEIMKRGGVAMVVRSLEDVEALFKQLQSGDSDEGRDTSAKPEPGRISK